MSNLKLSSTLVIMRLVLSIFALFPGARPARAQSSSASYLFLVGAGFLCDSADSSSCPAVVKSENGDSYEMSGAGTFSMQGMAVDAAGTYTRKSPQGLVVETGVWMANKLVSFDSYGITPGPLTREGGALGPPQSGLRQVGPRGRGIFPAPVAVGGLAVLRIRLLPVLGFARNATLEVNCALGKVPSEHQVEGIRLSFENGGAEFDEEISGRALILLNRFAASGAAKASAPDVNKQPAPTDGQQ